MPTNEVLDNQWIEAYRELSPYSALVDTKLRSSRSDLEKVKFIESGFCINPELHPDVDLEKINDYELKLTALREDIGESEDEEFIRDAYIPRINELLTNLRMLRASSEGNNDVFMQANIEKYGEPRPDSFYYVLSHFHDFTTSLLEEHLGDNVGVAAKVVLDVLPDKVKFDIKLPSDEEFNSVKDLFSDFYTEMLEGLVVPNNICGNAAKDLARLALQNVGLDYKVVSQKQGLTTMSVDHTKKQFKIPDNERYTRERFIGLLGHEGRIHIEERVQGENQPLRILYSGLANYLKGSEGKGLLAEQIVYCTLDTFTQTSRFHDIARRYLSIGLARGTDGNGERDFVEVFKIMNAIDFLWEINQTPEDINNASQRSVERTWELLALRTLRGYTGKGSAAMKDKIYFEGNLDQWNVLVNTPSLFPYLNLGKFDASNRKHLQILKRAGIIPVH